MRGNGGSAVGKYKGREVKSDDGWCHTSKAIDEGRNFVYALRIRFNGAV